VTHTRVSKIEFLCYSKSETIKTNWSRDGPRLNSENLRRGCRLQEAQCKGRLRAGSMSLLIVVAGEVQLAWGGIREHEAFLGHKMRGPAGTGRGGVSMA